MLQSIGLRLLGEKKEELGLDLLEWPSYSPDLNPIEGIWSYWKARVRRRMPSSIAGLERVYDQEWSSIPPNVITSTICSMPRRLSAVIEAKGGHIKY